MKQIDTIVLVEDINVSRKFYLNVIGLTILHDWESMIVFTNRLAIHQVNLLQPAGFAKQFLKPGKQGKANLIIYLETDNEKLESCCTRLKDLGVPVIHEIVDLPWQRIFRISDPDGHIIEIGEPH